MDIRHEYLNAIGISEDTYLDEKLAVDRVRATYGTARRGQLGISAGQTIWTEFFQEMVPTVGSFPTSTDAFDSLAVEKIKVLTGMLRVEGKGDFGRAQKMFNLFMKDFWALGKVSSGTEPCLHLPVDGGVLSKLTRVPPGWSTWTKVSLDDGEESVLSGYLRIQHSYRRYWHDTGARYGSPIEFDQVIWNRILLVP